MVIAIDLIGIYCFDECGLARRYVLSGKIINRHEQQGNGDCDMAVQFALRLKCEDIKNPTVNVIIGLLFYYTFPGYVLIFFADILIICIND